MTEKWGGRWSVVGGLLLLALALVQLALYLVTRAWGERVPLDRFILVFGLQFALYLVALWLIGRGGAAGRSALLIIVVGALAFRLVMATAFPALSSDIFRYVWDGRMQAVGLSPYAYPPAAPDLAARRDPDIWPRINRPEAVTIYPPAAQLAYLGIVRLGGDRVGAFKAAMLMAEAATLGLLVLLLRTLGRPLRLLVVYGWSPLAVYEVAGAAHLEGMMMPLLALTMLAAWRGRWATAGAALAGATLMKLFPIVLLPAFWWQRSPRLPLAFAATTSLLSLPYLAAGRAVLTYYPVYLREQFNMSAAALAGETLRVLGVADPYRVAQLGLLALVAALGLAHLARPRRSALFTRALALIGLLTIGSQFLHPWYVLWLLPFLTVLWPWPLADEKRARPIDLPRPTTWLAWLLFSGSVALSYHFYIRQTYHIPLMMLEYAPLYGLLLWPWLASATRRLAPRLLSRTRSF